MATKWAGPDGAPRKAIYWSYLVREPGILVKLKGEVRKSKFSGKPDYIYIQVPDDENEYALNLEPGVEQAFRDAPTGVWLRCHAKGSKDTPPSVSFADQAGPILPNLPASEVDEWEPMGAPQAGPPPMFPEDDRKEAAIRNREDGPASPTTAKHSPHPTMNPVMYRCWTDAVSLVRADFPDATADAGVEAASRIATTLYIQASK